MSLPTRALANDRRHAAIAEYRRKVWDKYEVVPLPHQAEWILASEGWVLTDQPPTPGSPQTLVMLDDESIEPRLLVPRQDGAAHVLCDFAGFKSGKSWSGAMWMAGFAGVDGAGVDLIGIEYDTCEPEFNYLIEFLTSERGMNLEYESLRNNKKDGAMWLTLKNGAHFECKSYRASRKSETMKGKTRDAYYFCLPMDAPVWMGDYSFKPLSAVRVGDEIIGMTRDNLPTASDLGKGKYSRMKRRGGRAIIGTPRRRLERGTVTAIHRKMDYVVRLTMESGRTVYCTRDHRWLSGAVSGRMAWVTPGIGRTLVHIMDDPGPPPPNKEWELGWLAGMYDGEGSRTVIAQYRNHNTATHQMLYDTLVGLGFDAVAYDKGVRWNGGRQACLKFLNWTRSPRYRSRWVDETILAGRMHGRDKIAAIEVRGFEEVGCITTTLGNFVAYGYLSHNCEAYQLPGFHVWTHVSQNVRQRNGFGVFATTPDRAWVRELHDKAHGKDPYYHCTCNIDAECNPFTFDRAAKDRDDPDKGGLMTRERFAVAWGGKVQRHIGAVYDYEKAAQMCTPLNFPQLWNDDALNLAMEAIQ